jgi:hypothetical protein
MTISTGTWVAPVSKMISVANSAHQDATQMISSRPDKKARARRTISETRKMTLAPGADLPDKWAARHKVVRTDNKQLSSLLLQIDIRVTVFSAVTRIFLFDPARAAVTAD